MPTLELSNVELIILSQALISGVDWYTADSSMPGVLKDSKAEKCAAIHRKLESAITEPVRDSSLPFRRQVAEAVRQGCFKAAINNSRVQASISTAPQVVPPVLGQRCVVPDYGLAHITVLPGNGRIGVRTFIGDFNMFFDVNNVRILPL